MREKNRSIDSTPMRTLPMGLVFPPFEVFTDFRFEAPFDAFIGFKLNSFNVPITMAMVVPVRIVVPENAAAINAYPVGIDERE